MLLRILKHILVWLEHGSVYTHTHTHTHIAGKGSTHREMPAYEMPAIKRGVSNITAIRDRFRTEMSRVADFDRDTVGMTALLAEVTALCAMLFTLFHFPCGTTCLTIRRETGSGKWTALAAALPTAVGAALCIAVRLFCSLV